MDSPNLPGGYGKLHPTVQQFDSGQQSFAHAPHVDPCDIRTWFNGDNDDPAFYTPPSASDKRMVGGDEEAARGLQYPRLTYRQLHAQMDACPPWPSPPTPPASSATSKNDLLVIGVLLLPDLMTELAIVHLCIMSGGGSHHRRDHGGSSYCSAPLDPTSSRQSLLRAMDQMECGGLVTARFMMDKYDLGFLLGERDALDELERSVADRMVDVRAISSGVDDDKRRDGSVTWDILHQKEVPSLSGGEQIISTTSIDEEDSVARASAAINADPSHPPLLLLRTSGTTALPKLVPLTGPQLLHNAHCQIKAMDLTSDDCTVNAMPLFHIGGMSCSFFSVLASGGSAIYCGSFEPERFINQICGWHDAKSATAVGGGDVSSELVRPTWYNAVPTMHQAILIHANSSPEYMQSIRDGNKLRFVRSGAANLSSNVASDLETVFGTNVINSFALSECMPVCVQLLSDAPTKEVHGESVSGPPVGIPVGPSLRIADPETGRALPFGQEGSICISGPGVIASYLNVHPSDTHTSDGWLITGDVGQIDPNTCQVRITGRAKEMIKRGGEQVWPTTVDGVIQGIGGVKSCVTFGVKNELLGEEVATAVVLENNLDQESKRALILEACREQLDRTAIPAQILFVQETDLLKGPSGKYLRNQMAEHLRVESADTGALRIIRQAASMGIIDHNETPKADERVLADETPKADGRVLADNSIDGIRIIASIMVVMNHVGFFPTSFLEKLARFNISIPIFFILAAFKLSLSVVGEITWVTFVGTRIGNLHSLFITTQLIALPSLLIFKCAGDGGGSCGGRFYLEHLLTWFLSTLTGMFGTYNDSNPPTWFMTVIYQFFVIFPSLDRWTRRRTKRAHLVLLVTSVSLSTAIAVAVFFGKTPNPRVNKLRWSIVGFFPTLFASMLCAYFFKRSKVIESTMTENEQKKTARRWALITDGVSVVLLMLCILVALSECTWLPGSTVAAMRPGEPLSEASTSVWPRMPPPLTFERRQGYGQLTESSLFKVCDIKYDEFVTFLHDSPLTPTNGRLLTTLGLYMGRLRMGTPIVMLWIYGLAQGHGLTATIMRAPPLLWISPLTYHLYLLHVPVARYYWMLTRDRAIEHRQFWYSNTPSYPIPILWWEVFLLIAICLILGAAIEHFVTPTLQPHTVRFGNHICDHIAAFFRSSNSKIEEAVVSDYADSIDQLLRSKVQALTGASNVTRDTNLSDLGLDSLGTTALLSILRSATPLAEQLSVQDLAEMNSVGELFDFLSLGGQRDSYSDTGHLLESGDDTNSPDEELGFASSTPIRHRGKGSRSGIASVRLSNQN